VAFLATGNLPLLPKVLTGVVGEAVPKIDQAHLCGNW
jgi:hypothetical protein